jgi:thiol-disulfide isomerase/thioredoxin
MNRRVAWLLAVVGLGIAALVVWPLFNSSSHPSGPESLAGEAAPVYPMHDDLGRPVSLAQYRGKVVVMNLWASWCPPCRAEMPDLQKLQSAYASQGVVVVGVNQGESAERAREFANSLGLHFPIWIDDAQEYGRVYAALGLPTTVVIGRDGIVVHGYDGALAFPQMRDAIRSLAGAQ